MANKKQDGQVEMETVVGHYLTTFTTKDGREVLKDLRKAFCGSISATDPIEMAVSVGKREVIKKIEAMLVLGKKPDVIESLFVMPEDDVFDL